MDIFNKNDNNVFSKKNEVELVQFKNLLKYSSMITHCFTTRKGGVSSNECKSLNLGFGRNDSRKNVEENYRRVADALGISIENMVFSNQVHDNKVFEVGEKDKGKGIIKKSDIIGYDGLITDKRGVALVTFYADCVPLFFFEPDKKVIALSHSGWRGTVKQIAAETVRKFIDIYDCDAGKIEVVIGPSIGACCFEVGDEVYDEFVGTLKWSREYCKKNESGKWYIDLQGIIKKTLIESGVSEENIYNSGICTKCNKDTFFSYRGDCGKTGSLAAILQML